ncbi:hypothetical protein ID866_6995, partial [Astraeus odoratus]
VSYRLTLPTVLTCVFSVIVLGICAHLISLTETYYAAYYTFAALGVATAVLTLVTLPVMLAIDFLRTGAFTSKILVELIWLFILWVLWVATAGEAVNTVGSYLSAGCSIYDGYPTLVQACYEVQAVEAFSFLAFFALLGYTITLLAFACIAASRGNSVWLSTVKETTFLAPAQAAPPAQQPIPMGQYQGTPFPEQQVPQAQPHYTGSPPPPQQPYYGQTHPVPV